MTAVEDLFHTRTVSFAFHRSRVDFDLARTVFSSANVDPGSALLLRHVQSLDLSNAGRILDLGCGHGTIGVVLKALDRDRQVVFCDRDALACRYTVRNLVLNDLLDDETTVVGSLGYDDVPRGGAFDLIVSNIPGKAGPEVIEELLLGAGPLAAPGALLAVVVVDPLAPQVREVFERPGFELVLDKGNKTHTVLIARLPGAGGSATAGPSEPGGFESGVYDRHRGRFTSKDLSWSVHTVAGIDEFDSLAQPTRLLRQSLQGVRATPSTVINPGQGHRAVIAALAGYPPSTIVSRDLLAIRSTQRCLIEVGHEKPVESRHTVQALDGPVADDGLTIFHLDDKVHGPWLTAEVKAMLDRFVVPGTGPRPQHHLVLSGRAGVLGRLEADLLNRRPGHVAYKKGVKGHRVIRFVAKATR